MNSLVLPECFVTRYLAIYSGSSGTGGSDGGGGSYVSPLPREISILLLFDIWRGRASGRNRHQLAWSWLSD
ncbi:unnamed protein product [Calypogeia fissa]